MRATPEKQLKYNLSLLQGDHGLHIEDAQKISRVEKPFSQLVDKCYLNISQEPGTGLSKFTTKGKDYP